MNPISPGADESEELRNSSPAKEPSTDSAATIESDAANNNESPAVESALDDGVESPESTLESAAPDEPPTDEDAAVEDSADTLPELTGDEDEVLPVDTQDRSDALAALVEAEGEDVAAETETTMLETAESVETEGQRGSASEQKLESPFKRGELYDAVIIATSPTSVQVEIDGIAQGIVPGRELERMNRETIELLKPGETIPVYVVNPHDHQGHVVLSINRALEELDWRKAEEYRESKVVYESRVAGYNKGGLIVRFGRVRGFVPQSQISSERRATMEGETPEERWGNMVNDEIAVKVMEVDRSRNRLILSERAATREVRETRKYGLIGDLELGEIRTGRVVSLVDFGAFIDVGGAEGLVHLTELSWQHVTHAREILKVGDEVKVEVISIDPERKRIGLSMRSLMEDPWDTVAIEYNIGQLVQGKITKLTKFGAFAQLVDAPAIEGLIHISELSDQRVNHPREVVNEGEILTLRVVKMDIENRRLGLSLKAVNSAEYLDQDWDY